MVSTVAPFRSCQAVANRFLISVVAVSVAKSLYCLSTDSVASTFMGCVILMHKAL